MINIKYDKFKTNIKATEFNDKTLAYKEYEDYIYVCSLPFNNWIMNKKFESLKGKIVLLINQKEKKIAYAIVGDVGPFKTDDHEYIYGDQRPITETLFGLKDTNQYSDPKMLKLKYKDRFFDDKYKNPEICNGAGIDLKPEVMKLLTDNYIPNKTSIYVDWCFIKEETLNEELLKFIKTKI